VSTYLAHDELFEVDLMMYPLNWHGNVLDAGSNRIGVEDVNAWLAVTVDGSGVDAFRWKAQEGGDLLKGDASLHSSEDATSLAVSRVEANYTLLSHLPVDAHSIHKGLDAFTRAARTSIACMIAVHKDDEAVG